MSDTTDNHINTISLLKKQLAEKEDENIDLLDRINKYRFASEGANDGLWDKDLAKNQLYVSKPWKAMLGLDSDDEIELNGLWESLLHPEDKEKAIATFNEFISSKSLHYNNVFRLRHRDGSYRWIRSKAKAKFDEKGKLYRMSGAHIDITEQREAISALSISEKKYKALFQNSLVAIFRSKIDTGEIVEYNNEFSALVECNNEDKLSALDLYYDLSDRSWLISELQKKGKIEQHEIQFKKVDGTTFWVSLSAAAYPEENLIECILIDITKSVDTREAVKQNELKYQMLFENSVIGIVREDMTTGAVHDSNEKLWDILGEKDPKGKVTLDYYLNLDDRARIMESREGDRIENVELQIRRGDGELAWVLINTRLFFEENLAESIIIDITNNKENHIELQKVNFELDSFVYHSSHDLRSPLRSILGLINIYRLEEDDYLRNEYINRIESSINKLDHLVKELLSISRNDRVNDPFADINFMIEVEQSVDGYYNALDTDNLSLETRIKQPCKFVSDLTRVKIILNNIISNAIKYRDPEKENSKVLMDVSVSEKEAVIVVKDNGEGIPTDQIPLIFDMFHRASDHSEGSGLGLYIVKNLVNKLNATITVDSEPYEETTFTITIPNSININHSEVE